MRKNKKNVKNEIDTKEFDIKKKQVDVMIEDILTLISFNNQDKNMFVPMNALVNVIGRLCWDCSLSEKMELRSLKNAVLIHIDRHFQELEKEFEEIKK